MKTIRIGTRASKLALWQTEYVANKLNFHGFRTETVLIDTKGDQVLDTALSKIGGKGLFTHELEEQLLDGRIDIAVHSAKDMPAHLNPRLQIIAFSAREKPHDVLVSLDPSFDPESSGAVLGTSSARRQAFASHFFPFATTVDIRGNLQTRMRKLREGQCGALILAYAGVQRMGFAKHIVRHLDTDRFVPMAGQGSIAVEAASRLGPLLVDAVRQAVNDPETETTLRAERAFLKALNGGCSIPVFCLARLDGSELLIQGGITALDGSRIVRTAMGGPASSPEMLGERLAAAILVSGGKEILDQIRGR